MTSLIRCTLKPARPRARPPRPPTVSEADRVSSADVYAHPVNQGYGHRIALRNRLAVPAQALDVAPYRVRSHRPRFLQGLAIGDETRQRRTGHGVSPLRLGLQEHRILVRRGRHTRLAPYGHHPSAPEPCASRMGHQTRGCAASKTVNQPGIPDADRAHPPAGVDVLHGNVEAHMDAVEDFRSWLGLVAKDLCDATRWTGC